MTIAEMKNMSAQERCTSAYEKLVASQPKLNAAITMIDPSEQLAANVEGKLAGIPVAVKDNMNTKDILTTAASNILDNYLPIFDATVVKKLKEAGAIIVAKSSMDELAMGGTNQTANIGACHNPYDLNRISGGSSGGSAALVAANVVPVALGSDTGDSIRKPASFCGVVGVKPTYGRISRFGVIPYASSLDHVGYFTQSVEDAALMLEVLAGRDDLDMTSSNEEVKEYSKLLNSDLKGKKILVFKNVIDAIEDQEIIKAFNEVVAKIKEKGAIVKEATFDQNLMRAIYPTYAIIANAEATANHANLDGIRYGHRVDGDSMEDIMINTRTRGFSTHIKKRFVIGSYSLNEENQERILKKAQRVRRLIVEDFVKELKDVDAIIAPAASSVAPKLEDEDIFDGESDQYLIADNFMVIGNFGGFPSMTIPMMSENGLPVGLNITSNLFKEEDMFDVAAGIEEITGLKNSIKEDF